VQLFGAEPEVMAEAARMVEPLADVIDINMGCGVPKVIKERAGAALMADLDRAQAMVRAVTAAVSRPVTVKMRRSYDARWPAAVELARRAQAAGAAAVTVHPRDARARYRYPADWAVIGEVKRAVEIPVIGNGDVRTPREAARMIEETGCDAVMIGRAALGNPFIFQRTTRFLSDGEALPEPTPAERLALCLEHGRMLIGDVGEAVGVRTMRTQIAWYAKGFAFAAEVRAAANRMATWREMEALLRETMAALAAERLDAPRPRQVAVVAGQKSSVEGDN
jgi:tRNA-dihydrouridine synthase B